MIRNINARIPAFSMIEMLIVLLLSSLAISALYVTFYTVSVSQKDLVKRYTLTADRSDVYFLIKNDFEQCLPQYDPLAKILSCYCRDSSVLVKYSFEPNYVLRRQNLQTDTFRCKTDAPDFFFKGALIEDKTSFADAMRLGMDGLIDTLALRITANLDRASLIQTTKDTMP